MGAMNIKNCEKCGGDHAGSNKCPVARIVTNFEYPPIPIRSFDWSAVDDATYDGEGCPIGRGATEQEAIDDLLEQICMERGADVDHNNGCRYCAAEAGIKCRAEIIKQEVEPKAQ